jgi:protein-S-isoprenylcysteine O-methyltransferase Ste14
MQTIVNFFGLLITWAIWIWLAVRKFESITNLVIAVVGGLAIIPVVFAGRWMLERQPDVRRAELVTTGVHYLIAIFLGSAIITATRFALESPTLPLSFPPWIGLTLMALSGLALILATVNLVNRGRGAPFAIAITRVIVTDWMYAWTRNPMILSALALLVGLGIYLGSGLFLVWLLAVVSPAVLVFLKFYEERELEIRFGNEYMSYKSKTPRLVPRRPESKD